MKKGISFLIIYLILFVFMVSGLHAETSLTWEECLKITLENHPDLISAKEKINQAEALIGISRSGWFPGIDASASASKSRTENSQIKKNSDSFAFGLSVQQLIFDGGKTRYDVKKSEESLKAKKYDYNVTAATVAYNARSAFVSLIKAREQLEINKEIRDMRKSNLELVRLRYQAGREHRGSLLTAEANLAQSEQDIVEASRSIDLAVSALYRSMGVEKIDNIAIIGELTIPEAEETIPDFTLITNENPELKSIVQQRIISEYALKSSKADYYPRVYGVAGVNRSGNDWFPDETRISAGIQMSLNIFQGGKNHYQTKQTEAALKQLFADEKNTRTTIAYYLEQAWINLQNSIEQVKVQEKFLNAAIERVKITDAQYSIGSVLFDNWIVVQDSLVSARQKFLTVKTSALIAEAEWIQLKGEIIQ